MAIYSNMNYIDDFFNTKGAANTTPSEAAASTTASVPDSSNATRNALTRLTSGATLTAQEKMLLNIGNTGATTDYATTYKKAKIWDTNGNQVEVYAEGPNAGYAVDGNYLVIQGEAPVAVTGGNVNGTLPGGNNTTTPAMNTNVQVLKAALVAQGIPAATVDESIGYLNQLLLDLDGDVDNTAEIFLNLKDYTLKNGTKISSPFYTAYGYLNEGLTNPKSPSELFNFVQGAKEVATKYNLGNSFMTNDVLKDYVKNGVTVDDIDARANLARLASISADKAYLDSLKAGGYISDDTGLTGFFLNSKIGKQQLEQNRGIASIGAAAIRRAESGISYNKARFEKLAADMAAQGYSPEEIQAKAEKNFETISLQQQPMEMLTGIYNKTAANASGIQAQLETEAFGGPASAERKRLKAMEEAAFNAQSGTSGYSLSTGGGLGQAF